MNQTAEFDLTIIVPVYNEEDNCRALEERLGAYVSQSKRPACVLFVNDGSTDSSEAKIAAICSRHDNMFYISFAANCGLSAAIKAGFDAAESPLVGYIDADLQTAPEDFDLLLDFADDYELVMGIRANRKDTGFKRLQSKIANGFRRMMTGDDAIDTGCPLKILHTDVARRIPMFTGMHRFLPALVGLQQGKVKQVPVRHFPRVAGKSKFSLSNRLVGPTMDCFAFRWMRPRWYNYKIGSTDLKG
ncbi:MAG: glycosyltransferase [Muribaculaceae bacterium]|nr:glycosyltransferase [Muribaculaceae bacterium]MDE7336309.1 glycosyltransferase [Muribaculaceae bacterium]